MAQFKISLVHLTPKVLIILEVFQTGFITEIFILKISSQLTLSSTSRFLILCLDILTAANECLEIILTVNH